MATDREELEALRRLAELEARAGTAPPAMAPPQSQSRMQPAQGRARSAITDVFGVEQYIPESLKQLRGQLEQVPGLRRAGEFVTGAQSRLLAPFQGAAELVEQGIQSGVNRLIPAPAPTLSGLITGQQTAPQTLPQQFRQYVNQTVDADTAALRAREQAFRENAEQSGAAQAGGLVGDVAAATLLANRLGGGYRGAAVTGGLLGATQPGATAEQRAQGGVTGAGLGLLGQGVGNALTTYGTRAAQAITPEVRRLYQEAQQRGIQLLPWQLGEAPFLARARGVLSAIPFSGAKQRVAAQAGDFDRAVAKTIGEDLQPGESLNPSVLGRAYDRLGGEFDRLFSGGTATDRQFLRDVARIRQDAAATGNQEAQSATESLVKRVRKQGAGGNLPGKALQSVDRQARKLQQSGDPDRIAVGDEFRDAVQRLYARTAAPADATALRTARTQYRAYKTIEPVVARAGGVPPPQLLGAVNATKSGRAQVARGEGGELAELARIGQQIKPAQTSGTAENLFSGASLLGGAVNLPVTLKALLAGNVGSRVLDSPLLARYLLSQGRGQARQAAGRAIRPVPIGLLPYLPGSAAAEEAERYGGP